MPHTVNVLVKRVLLSSVLTFAAGLILFALVRIGGAASEDRKLTASIHEITLESSSLSRAAELVTTVGDPLVLTLFVAIVGAVLLMAGHRRLTVWLVVVTAAGATVESGLKLAIQRTRPDLETAILDAHGTSFPSGHAMNTAIVFASIALAVSAATNAGVVAQRAMMAGAASIAIAVATTRVLLGVHFVSDVTAGLMLAVLWVSALQGLRVENPARKTR